MKLRSHFLPTLNNQEVEDYLKENDVIFVPVGPVEMHGALPLDCETVVSEALALLLRKGPTVWFCLIFPIYIQVLQLRAGALFSSQSKAALPF